MGIEFTGKEILLIHGHFKKEIKQLEDLKAAPACPIDKRTLNKEIKLFSAITKKIEDAYPQLAKLNF